MATRSTIGILNKDGSVEYSYCHWDGYPEHNGKILLQYYKTEKRVRQLLEYGSISLLGKYIVPSKGVMHTFNDPQDDVCIFYHRDRGDALTLDKNSKPIDQATARSYGWEYNYLFADGKWMYMPYCMNEYIELTPGICGIEASA